MAAPILAGTQSVLGYLVGQSLNFQPLALNTPTSWTSTTLPPGLSINGSTGLVSGAVTAPGIYVVSITATNSDGSAFAPYTFGIEAGASSMSTDVDITIDVVTKAVALTAGVPLASTMAPEQTANAAPSPPVCVAKYGDDFILNIRLAKNGTTIAPTVTAAAFTLKETGDDAVLVTSTTFVSSGSGDATRYRVYALLTGDALKGAVSDGAGTVQTREPMLAQVSLTYTNPTGSFGPSTLTLTSDNFTVLVVDSLA